MKKSPIDHHNDQGKVVSLQLDAKFYFERAMQSIERHRYDRALKYFRLSIEKEPENPVNYCNLAGLLAELGEFNEANQVLEMVLSDIDPNFHECLFYMANNYAFLGEYELAEKHLLEYLKRDPYGEYIEEVEEMLDLLAQELGRSPGEYPIEQLPQHMQEHERARKLLEKGDFREAAKLLQELIKEQPYYWPAYNNLSLAYYYLGEIEKALHLSEHVIAKDPHNLHAQCNRVLFVQKTGDQKAYGTLLKRLKKLVPLNGEQLYKLAITFGILEEHESAYQLFFQLLRMSEFLEASFFHQLAAAAWNTGRLQKARRYWQQAVALDPESDVPRFYLAQLNHWLDDSKQPIPTVQYHYQLPFEEKIFQLQVEKKKVESLNLQNNPLLTASFFWVFNGQDLSAKAQVIQLLGLVGNKESERLLRHYLLLETKGDEDCKKLALFMLRRIGASPPYPVWMQDQLMVIEKTKNGGVYVNRDWAQILISCQQSMSHYSTELKKDAKALLLQFIKKQAHQLPLVRRVEPWAAALEYLVVKHQGLSITQLEVAQKYQISPSTVAYYVKKLSAHSRDSET